MFKKVDGDAGGGQILRNGFSLAALVGQPIHVVNIRGSRTPPGLRAQHLTGIRLIAEICGGALEGAQDGSREVKFKPGAFRAGCFLADAQTAGSCTLLAQIALPCMIFAPGAITLTAKGGTDVNWSPPIDEMSMVLRSLLHRFGVNFDAQLVRRGFYPKGGGEIRLTVKEPSKGLKSVSMMDRGNVTSIFGRAFAAGDRERKELIPMVTAAQEILAAAFPGIPIRIDQVVESPQTANGFGAAITLIAETDTACMLAATQFRDQKQNMSGVDCGRGAAQKLLAELDEGGCVDQYTQDQLLLFMALANGRSQVRVGHITEHSQLAIETAQTLTPCKFEIQNEGKTNVISCVGIGLTSPGHFASSSAAAAAASSSRSSAPKPTPPPPQQLSSAPAPAAPAGASWANEQNW